VRAATEVSVGQGGKEREGERETAAVAGSIRHAGLQCKLLHGHRCVFLWEKHRASMPAQI